MFQRVLLVDPVTGFYKTKKFGFDRYFGPVDLEIHLTKEYRSLRTYLPNVRTSVTRPLYYL